MLVDFCAYSLSSRGHWEQTHFKFMLLDPLLLRLTYCQSSQVTEMLIAVK